MGLGDRPLVGALLGEGHLAEAFRVIGAVLGDGHLGIRERRSAADRRDLELEGVSSRPVAPAQGLLRLDLALYVLVVVRDGRDHRRLTGHTGFDGHSDRIGNRRGIVRGWRSFLHIVRARRDVRDLFARNGRTVIRWTGMAWG